MKIKLYHCCYLLLSAVLVVCTVHKGYAQHDSLIFKNGNTVVGEIKSLSNGVLIVKTDYSKSDLSIKWTGVKEIYTPKRLLLTLKDGTRLNGSIESVKDSAIIRVISESGKSVEAKLDDLVTIVGLTSGFWSRLKANIDVGLSFTKSNNLRQVTIRSGLSYLADRWMVSANFNSLRSKQDSVIATKRIDGALSFQYFLQNDWYLASSISFLSNTEQALKLRTIGKLGAGKMLIHSNRSYWGVGVGVSLNNEEYTNDAAPSKNSMEGYFGTELNLYDIGDLSLLSSVYAYPSFTEKGRWRSDVAIDSKYDFPWDFYAKLGLTLNYDNQPAISGRSIDYVVLFTVGWELK